jgi:hypothetical protein
MTTTQQPASPQPSGLQARRRHEPVWSTVQGLCVAGAVLGLGILSYAPLISIIANPFLALVLAMTAALISAATAYAAGLTWTPHRSAALAMALIWALTGVGLTACRLFLPGIVPLGATFDTTAAEYAQDMAEYQMASSALAVLYAALYTGAGALTMTWARRARRAHHPGNNTPITGGQ